MSQAHERAAADIGRDARPYFALSHRPVYLYTPGKPLPRLLYRSPIYRLPHEAHAGGGFGCEQVSMRSFPPWSSLNGSAGDGGSDTKARTDDYEEEMNKSADRNLETSPGGTDIDIHEAVVGHPTLIKPRRKKIGKSP